MSDHAFVHYPPMKSPIVAIQRFFSNLGPVEQAQMVSSTAVIVSMATIVASMFATNQEPRPMDFISVLTVGLIGYMSVYFSLTYSRQLDAQRKQLLALNTIAEAVNKVVQLDLVLQTALTKTTELLSTPFGWIYMLEGQTIVLKCSRGTTIDFFATQTPSTKSPSTWLHQPRVQRERLNETIGHIPLPLKSLGIQFWASIPLKAKEHVVGTLIVAGEDFDMFTGKQAELMEAFGNQISVAVNNAQLFERVKQSERQYADLFENSPDIYLHISREHTILGCNKTGADMLGYTKHELVKKPFEEFFVPDRQEAVRTMLATMFTQGLGAKDVEEQMVKKDGGRLFVNLNSSLVFDERGTSINARIVARDISERKKMEGAILHAQKIDSIGNLAGGIAHDFNN
ncbi:MAG: PAS domain S-box protein, partial [Bacteroidota bacterium]